MLPIGMAGRPGLWDLTEVTLADVHTRAETRLESVDAMVFVLGYRAEDSVVRELEGDGPKVIAIGDCRRGGPHYELTRVDDAQGLRATPAHKTPPAPAAPMSGRH